MFPSSSRLNELLRAKKLAEDGELDQAYHIASNVMLEEPNNVQALVVTTYILRRARKFPEAYHIARRVTELEPDEAAGWINYGQVCADLFRSDESERAYKRGLSVAKDRDSISMLHTNLSALYIDTGRFKDALKSCEESLRVKPESQPARANLGFCQLATRQWAEGWANYQKSLGTESRTKAHYRQDPEPQWDGSDGKRVIIYGEQGIGDEICFASMLNDAIAKAGHIVLDVDPRLEKLYRRSFPKAKVYGTRVAKPGGRIWDKADHIFDCSIPVAQLGQFFRLTDDSFPSAPYLVADPDRTMMWRHLWKNKGKPIIGLAWTGGTWQTGGKFRKLQLEQFLPLMESIDAHYVSLQYKDARSEIERFRTKHPHIDIEQYEYATLTSDYDDTAALVSSLDLVLSVPTAVVHLSAALGVQTVAMNSPHPCWKFSAGLPFHPKVTLIPNQGWDKTITNAVKVINDRLTTQEAA